MVAVTVGEGRRAPPPWLDRAERRLFARLDDQQFGAAAAQIVLIWPPVAGSRGRVTLDVSAVAAGVFKSFVPAPGK